MINDNFITLKKIMKKLTEIHLKNPLSHTQIKSNDVQH